MASFGHCTSHARQTRHASTLTGCDLASFISNTLVGHESLHVPQPSHLLWSILISTILGLSPFDETYQN